LCFKYLSIFKKSDKLQGKNKQKCQRNNFFEQGKKEKKVTTSAIPRKHKNMRMVPQVSMTMLAALSADSGVSSGSAVVQIQEARLDGVGGGLQEACDVGSSDAGICTFLGL
jgi:hypothetical protein